MRFLCEVSVQEIPTKVQKSHLRMSRKDHFIFKISPIKTGAEWLKLYLNLSLKKPLP